MHWSETTPRVTAAAAPSTVDPGGSARLTATARDPDGGSIDSYEWSQTSGPEGRFDRTDGATATWTAPKPVEVENPNVEIQVVVTDDEGETATGAVTIAVSNPSYSVRYSGQQHAGQWMYYTRDSRTRGQPTISVSTLAGVPVLVCGHDGTTNGGLYCGDGVNHEWAYVDASLSGGLPPEPPLLPGLGLTVTPALAALEVSWNTVPDTTNYLVLWKSGGQAYATERRETVRPPTTSYTITGLMGGTEYTVKVRAFSVEIEEAEATGTPPRRPRWQRRHWRRGWRWFRWHEPNGARRAHESAAGAWRRAGDAELGGTGGRRRFRDHRLRVPDQRAG